jgi:hypothetical protein
MNVSRPLLAICVGLTLLVRPVGSQEKPRQRAAKPRRVDTVLASIKPLPGGRKTQLQLYLWPAMDPGLLEAAAAQRLVDELNQRGVGLVCSWTPHRAAASLAQGLAIARAQSRLGLPVSVHATACLHSFFNGDKSTAHIDTDGRPFWDESFNFGNSRPRIGCPFTLDTRVAAIREQVESFARAYQEAGLKIDFIFADWEIDGPLDYNRAHEAARCCQRCRDRIKKVDDFLDFQKVVRSLRSELQRRVLATPILDRFPRALVGNYAVYPHNGYRYWYDYFEQFVEGQPHIADQRARYRVWAHEFPGTGYTMAMPVIYTWYPTFQWYDFAESDYRWFYNLLLVASNVGRSTPRQVPIVSFVHWHTTAPPPNPDPQVKAMSRKAYQELLWHALLRGTRTFFLWCPAAEDVEECQAVHEVYAAAQEYAPFIDRGVPVAFDVPKQPAPVVSGLLLGKRLLVRRTDFGAPGVKAEITVAGQTISIPTAAGQCQLITLPLRPFTNNSAVWQGGTP